MKPNNQNEQEPIQEPTHAWEALKGKVLALTGMSELEYAEGVYESGLAYLGLYWQNDERWTKRWSNSRTFWIWWRNQWALKDELFVAHLEQMAANILSRQYHPGERERQRLREELTKVYWTEHSECKAIAEIKPNTVLYKLIGKETAQ